MKRSGIGTAGLVSLAVGIAAATPAGAADRNPGFLKMALVNMRCLSSHGADASANQAAIRKNLDRHLYFVDRAAAEGAEFVGFPELSLNGYWYSQTMIWLKLDGPEVRTLAKKAIEKGVYIAAGMAEQDAAGKRWNTHFVLGPDGQIVGWHHKLWLTDDKAFAEAGTDHNVFDVKGLKMGITTCADGSNYANLKAHFLSSMINRSATNSNILSKSRR